MMPLPMPLGTCWASIEYRLRALCSVVTCTVDGPTALNTAMLLCSSSASVPRAVTARVSAAALAESCSGAGAAPGSAPRCGAGASTNHHTSAATIRMPRTKRIVLLRENGDAVGGEDALSRRQDEERVDL